MSLTLRVSRDDDVTACAAIYQASVATETASWEYDPPSVEEFAQRRADVIAQGYPYFTAEIDGTVVGYSYASAYRARIGYRFVVEDSVYVLKTMAGLGFSYFNASTIRFTTHFPAGVHGAINSKCPAFSSVTSSMASPFFSAID